MIKKLSEIKKLFRFKYIMSSQFTDEQILTLASRHYPSQLWIDAFNLYNLDKKNERLGMHCKPCYNKVLVYLLKIRFKK
jgi:hypothetical protein